MYVETKVLYNIAPRIMSGQGCSSIKRDTVCAIRLLLWSALDLCQQLDYFNIMCATTIKKSPNLGVFSFYLNMLICACFIFLLI